MQAIAGIESEVWKDTALLTIEQHQLLTFRTAFEFAPFQD